MKLSHFTQTAIFVANVSAMTTVDQGSWHQSYHAYTVYPLADSICTQTPDYFEISANIDPAQYPTTEKSSCLKLENFTPYFNGDKKYQRSLKSDSGPDEIVPPLKQSADYGIILNYRGQNCEDLKTVGGALIGECIQVFNIGDVFVPDVAPYYKIDYDQQGNCKSAFYKDRNCAVEGENKKYTGKVDTCTSDSNGGSFMIKKMGTDPQGRLVPALSSLVILKSPYAIVDSNIFSESSCAESSHQIKTRSLQIGQCSNLVRGSDPLICKQKSNNSTNPQYLKQSCSNYPTFQTFSDLTSAMDVHGDIGKLYLRYRKFMGNECDLPSLTDTWLINYDKLQSNNDDALCYEGIKWTFDKSNYKLHSYQSDSCEGEVQTIYFTIDSTGFGSCFLYLSGGEGVSYIVDLVPENGHAQKLNDGTLSTGALIAIVLGCIILIVSIILCFYFKSIKRGPMFMEKDLTASAEDFTTNPTMEEVIPHQSNEPGPESVDSVITAGQRGTSEELRKKRPTTGETLADQNVLAVPIYLMCEKQDIVVRKELAKGGQSKIYLAEAQTQFLTKYGRKVVVKYVTKESEDIFNQELSIMELFNKDSHFVKLLGYFHTPYAMITKYYPLGSLKQWLNRKAAQKTMNQLVSFMMDISNAIWTMHKLDVAHCDIKPDNVLLDMDKLPDETVNLYAVLTDFGISTIVSTKVLGVSEFHVVHRRGASLVYAAPEVLRRYTGEPTGSKAVVLAGDVYSFGISMSQMITRSKNIKLSSPTKLKERSFSVITLPQGDDGEVIDS